MEGWNSDEKCGRIRERLLVTGTEKWPLRTNTGDNCLIQVDLYIRLKWLIYLWKSTYLRKVLICSSSAQRFFSGMSVLASKPGSLTIQKNWAVLPTQNLTFAFIYLFLTKIHRTTEKLKTKQRNPSASCRKYWFVQEKMRSERISTERVVWPREKF